MSAEAETGGRNHRTSFVGMAFALGAFTMLFASLLFSYAVVRFHAGAWPPAGTARVPPALPVAAALVLLASSGVLWKTRRRALTALFGAAFLVLTAFGWRAAARAGTTMSSGVYGSVYFELTGIHALFVVAALIALAASRGHPATMLWHFAVVAGVVVTAAVLLP